MKKILLIILFITSCLSGVAQVTVYEDSFETYPNFVKTGFGNWQTLDFDLLPTYIGGTATGVPANWANAGTAMAYQIFTPSAANITNSNDACTSTLESRNFDPKTGLKYAACWNGVPSTTGGNTANNDWLISPVLTLGTTNNELKFWVKSLSVCYGLESYKVGVYVGSGTPTLVSDFTIISGATILSAPITWQEKTFSLSAYDNQTIRIGIQCLSADRYMFMVDDFKVTSSNLSTNDFISSKFSTYPNPASDVVTISSSNNTLFNEITITDLNGRIVKNNKVNNVSETVLNVSDLNAGIYFLNITSNAGKVLKKFLKN